MIRSFLIQLSLTVVTASAAALPIGEVLPSLSSETMSGKRIELPAADAGRVRVLVFSFSREAGSDSHLWDDRLAKESLASVSYRVIVLESVPRLFRGMAVAGIKSSMPRTLWDRTVLMYKDEAVWKQRLAVANDKHAYLLLIDGEGRVRWTGSQPFSERAFTELKEALARASGGGH
jgi:hypothetical protein